jgi:hypothetical protein
MTANCIDRRRTPHPAPMSHPHSARSNAQRFHGVAARGRQGGAVEGNLGWRVHKLEAVSSLRGLHTGFAKLGTTSPHRFLDLEYFF